MHGLGVNPSDGALFVATHAGLWRLAQGTNRPTAVGERSQDTMGFTVVGPDTFLGSGHPDARPESPPLGLIESEDAGRAWRTVSLAGEADFHVLRSDGTRVYGFDAAGGRLLVSPAAAGGRGSSARRQGAVLDLAVDPAAPTHLLTTGERGLLESLDEGRTWRTLGVDIGLLAWPEPVHVYRVGQTGEVAVTMDAGRAWSTVGSVGGFPASFTATVDELYVALLDGTIKYSADRGRSWQTLISPDEW